MADQSDEMAAALGVAPLTSEEQTALLDLARDVAHTTQRRNAPLSAFLLGVAVGQSDQPRLPALREAATAVRACLPEPTDPTAG